MTDALRPILLDAAEGRYPLDDGAITVVPPDATTGLHAVVSFTGHAVIATDRTQEACVAAGADGLAGALAPDLLRWLAGPSGWIGVIDVVLVARGTGTGGTTLAPTGRYDDHPRVHYARATRTGVLVLGDDRGLVTLGRGLGGRTELGFELVGPGAHGEGLGRGLLMDLRSETPAGEVLYASCAPGNARSLRALLAAGFTPIGGEVLLRPEGPPG